MWMNLDQLPEGKSMYTVYVSTQSETVAREDCEADEVDVVADRSATWGEVVNSGTVHPRGETAGPWIVEMYGVDSIIVGVVNQSDGFVLFDMWRDRERL